MPFFFRQRNVTADNLRRFMEDLSSSASEDEYLYGASDLLCKQTFDFSSTASPASPYASRKGFAMHAGHTPGPKGRSTTAGDRMRRLSVDFSGLISQKDIERV